MQAQDAWLRSCADAISSQFNQTVRPRSLILRTDSEHIAQGPKLIKLFINRPSLGFEEVEDAQEPQAAQVIELTEEQVKEGKPIPLRFVRFQSVNILHVRRVFGGASGFSIDVFANRSLCSRILEMKRRPE